MKPKVSVVLVVHPKYLSLLPIALKSLKEQTYPNLETIVVANGTKDVKADIYCDGTLAHACNQGIKAATGEYIIRIDADDWIEPNLVEVEVGYFDRHPGIDAVWCDYWKSYEEKGDGYSVHHLEHLPNDDLEHACGVMYRKDCWEVLGGYNETLEYQESFDFWLRFRKQFRVSRLALPLYFYRQHDGSMSSNLREREEARTRILKEQEDA